MQIPPELSADTQSSAYAAISTCVHLTALPTVCLYMVLIYMLMIDEGILPKLYREVPEAAGNGTVKIVGDVYDAQWAAQRLFLGKKR